MPTERVEIPAAEGRRLPGRLETPDEGAPRAWAVFAHCFSCGKDGLAAVRVSRALARRGVGVLRFDFAGIGGEDGEFGADDFSNDVEDLVCAARWLESQGRPVELMVGHSLGGAAALLAAPQIPELRALATIAAPADAAHVIEQFDHAVPEIERRGLAQVTLSGRPFTVTRGFLDDLRSHAEARASARLRCGFLVMHAPEDETVSIDNARTLFEAAKHPKSFVSLEGADHLLSRREDADYAAGVICAWAERYLSPPAARG